MMKFILALIFCLIVIINCSQLTDIMQSKKHADVVEAFEKSLEAFVTQKSSGVRIIARKEIFINIDLSVTSQLPFELLNSEYFSQTKFDLTPSYHNSIIFESQFTIFSSRWILHYAIIEAM